MVFSLRFEFCKKKATIQIPVLAWATQEAETARDLQDPNWVAEQIAHAAAEEFEQTESARQLRQRWLDIEPQCEIAQMGEALDDPQPFDNPPELEQIVRMGEARATAMFCG